MVTSIILISRLTLAKGSGIADNMEINGGRANLSRACDTAQG